MLFFFSLTTTVSDRTTWKRFLGYKKYIRIIYISIHVCACVRACVCVWVCTSVLAHTRGVRERKEKAKKRCLYLFVRGVFYGISGECCSNGPFVNIGIAYPNGALPRITAYIIIIGTWRIKSSRL